MKKLVLVLLVLFSLSLVSALNDTLDSSDIEDNGYSCLKGLVGNKSLEDFTLEELSFSILALGYDSSQSSRLLSELIDRKDSSNCFPKGSCKLKETSIAVLALNHLNQNTEDYEIWLIKQNSTPDNIEWYLQIDTQSIDQETSCKISYDSTSTTININKDKEIDRSAGACLTLDSTKNRLRVSGSCLSKTFEVSCNKDFLSNLIYKRKDSSIFYVSSKTQSSSAEGTTSNQVNSFCFKQGTSCNYEGSLWASLALKKTGNDLEVFIPYLNALSGDNSQYFPESFLFALTGDDDYLNSIVESQFVSGYWDKSGNKFYDTSLAILSLSSNSPVDNAKVWLGEVQGKNGCWNNNNLRDTAFVLYSAYPKAGAIPGTTSSCSSSGYYCTLLADCSLTDKSDLGGCSSTQTCCKTRPALKSCLELAGEECDSNEKCEGITLQSSGTKICCKSACIPDEPSVTESECEENNYNCRASCNDNEEETTIYACNNNLACCKSSAKKSYWWIWLLIILIILVILGIIFRNKIRLFFFRIKSVKSSKGPPPSRPSPFPRAMPARSPMMRPAFQFKRPAPIPAPVTSPLTKQPEKSGVDKELEDTLKKLREIGK